MHGSPEKVLRVTPDTSWGTVPAKLPPLAKSAPGNNQARLAYDGLPLSFEANIGQATEPTKFLAIGQGYRLELVPDGAVLHLTVPNRIKTKRRSERIPPHLSSKLGPAVSAKEKYLRLNFLGANPNPGMQGVGDLRGKSSYFVGRDPRQWHLNVPNYRRVLYQQIYPGIDLVYYGNQRQLEYDFTVQPGADPKSIRLRVTGARRIGVDSDGNLVLSTKEGEVQLKKPTVYQEVDNVRREIAANFEVARGNQISFAVGDYDSSRPLVI